MTAPGSAPVLDEERDIDLARWRAAVMRRWWIVVAGVILGAVVGVLVGSSGATSYEAKTLLTLGQPLSPGGAIIPSYGTNPLAAQEIVQADSVQSQVERQLGLRQGELRGSVAIQTVATQNTVGSTRATPLVELIVTGRKSDVAKAADALARVIVDRTSAKYVSGKITRYQTVLANDAAQVVSINKRIDALNTVLNSKSTQLQPLDRLVLVSEQDNLEQRVGNLLVQQASQQEALSFTENVESAKIITGGKARETSARSKATSLLVGALIGLLLGTIAAIVADPRLSRPTTV